MKVASKLILLFNDPDGVGVAIHGAIQPNPNSSIQRSEDSFQLSLEEGYGIEGGKACGEVAQFVDRDGELLVTVLLMDYYEPPVLACAINKILCSIDRQDQSMTLFILPFLLPASRFKIEDKNALVNRKSSIYGAQLGPETDFTHAIASETQKLPSSTQIHYEPLACLLHFVHVLKVPTVLLIGQTGQCSSNKAVVNEEHEVLHELGKLLGSFLHLSFAEDRIKLNQRKSSKVTEEPWRALYG